MLYSAPSHDEIETMKRMDLWMSWSLPLGLWPNWKAIFVHKTRSICQHCRYGAARHQGQWTTTAKQIAYEADWSAKASDPLGLVQPFVKVEVLTVGLSQARTNFVRNVYFNIAWNGLPNPTRKHSLPSVQLSILHQHLPTEPSLNKDARSLRQWDSNGDPYQIKVVYTLRRLLLHLLRLGGSLRWWTAPAKYAWWL